MNPATATVIAALITTVGSVVVAIITIRARNSPPPPVSSMPLPPEQRVAARRFRAVGWAIVAFLYLIAAALIATGLVGYVVVYQGKFPAGDLGLATGLFVVGVIFGVAGYWAQRGVVARGR